jgi:CO/xanthine dehydrogenase Mo-binding subunit
MEPVIAQSGLPWREAVALCVQKQIGLAAHGWSVPPATTFDLETGQGEAYICYTFSANVVELEVDTETGETRVLSVHSGHDVGRCINPTTGEVRSKAVWFCKASSYRAGRGHHLKDGKILNDQFSTPHHPTPLDVPEIKAIIVEHAYPGAVRHQGAGRDPDHRRRARRHRGDPPGDRRSPSGDSRDAGARLGRAARARRRGDAARWGACLSR